MYIECPHCETKYLASRCGVEEVANTIFTIICSVCEGEFDGAVIGIDGLNAVPDVPASRSHRWSFGLFGTPAIAGVPGVPSSLSILTRKR